MRQVIELFRRASDDVFLESQIKENHWNKHILFIQPSLNGRHFYRSILPYIVMFEFDAWGTAVTSIDKYKPNKEYEIIEAKINSQQILWADYIVFPFTNQDLKPLYEKIRSINPKINIVFNIDFNYYLVPKTHPLYEAFSTPETLEIIEDNIFYSNLALTTNSKLQDFIINKFKTDIGKRFVGKETNVDIGLFPLFYDEQVIFENVEMKIEDLDIDSKALRIGIIATRYTLDDIASYKDQFKEVSEKLGNKVQFILIGHNGIDPVTEKSFLPEGVDFKVVPPCSIIHYFRQLQSLRLDLMFAPLKNTEYNQTTENYNKFLEASLFKIPFMVYDIHPYSGLIKTGHNGILLSKKKDFLERIEFFNENREELKRIGDTANKMVSESFQYDEDNVAVIDRLFTKFD